eukprot:1153345-Pelagomonas_calceolata.AAC.6
MGYKVSRGEVVRGLLQLHSVTRAQIATYMGEDGTAHPQCQPIHLNPHGKRREKGVLAWGPGAKAARGGHAAAGARGEVRGGPPEQVRQFFVAGGQAKAVGNNAVQAVMRVSLLPDLMLTFVLPSMGSYIPAEGDVVVGTIVDRYGEVRAHVVTWTVLWVPR